MQIITSTVLDLSTEFENEVFENESLSSGATSSIFHPHAAKKCCAAHGYKMLHVAHQLNTAANSIFGAKKYGAPLRKKVMALVSTFQFFCDQI